MQVEEFRGYELSIRSGIFRFINWQLSIESS